MSHPLKKPRAVYPIEDYVAEDSEEEEMEDECLNQTVNVDFEGFTASDNDFHGIKRLLQQSFRGLEVDVSGMADTIISQNYVGSVIKQVGAEEEDEDDEEEDMEDDDQLFGVTTIINLTSRKDEKCISGFRTALVEKCAAYASDATSQQLRELLGNESKHVGLLISERVVNLPPLFALPVFESLGKELEEAKAKKMPYDFAYLILVCKVFKHEKRKKKSNKTVEKEIWSNPEEEVMGEEAVASFDYVLKGDNAVSGDWDEDDPQYTPFRRVLLMDAQRFPEILTKVKQAVYQQ